MRSTIIIVDFGSQYTQLIARRVREIGVYSEVLPFHRLRENILPLKKLGQNLRGIIYSGGPDSLSSVDAAEVSPEIYSLNTPILGICYGMHLLATHLGGAVQTAEKHEYGHTSLTLTEDGCQCPLLRVNSSHEASLSVWMSHSTEVSKLPPECRCVATSANCSIAGFEHSQRPWYGLQFHPEVSHTLQGTQYLRNFILNICQCRADEWTSDTIIDTMVRSVRNTVKDKHVVLGLSGGVDSSVVAALLHRAIGSQLTCIFVDTGLLRYQEGDTVMRAFSQHLGVHVVRVNAHDRFYTALHEVSDPEQKRKIIGQLFVDIFTEEAQQLPVPISFLAQGTIYPDVIESTAVSQHSSAQNAGKGKKNIKSHHNVGGLPENLPFTLLEPLRCLFKDEVRRLGVALGLSRTLVERHPFPGPGLGVRILGAVRPNYVQILQQADHIFLTELRKANWYDRVSQAFAVFLPVQSVGVVGDERRYAYVIALRAVETVDFMTASWAHLPPVLLQTVSNRIMNEIPQVARVVYDISGKPPSTIEWE